jgi:phospholipid/cholesterol/gamma-HCH transport system ATP-binding protein
VVQETTNTKIIEIKNLVKRFGERVVLDNVSLSIEKGKTTVIIGPSGCGKTVLLKHMVLLLRPTSGEIYFKDQRIDTLRDGELNTIRTHFGFLFQGGALFDSETVYQNLIFPLIQHTKKISDWKAVDELVKNKLALVGLDGYQNYFPANLSGGQKNASRWHGRSCSIPKSYFMTSRRQGLTPCVRM